MNQRTAKLLKRYGYLTGWTTSKQVRALKRMWNMLNWKERARERAMMIRKVEEVKHESVRTA